MSAARSWTDRLADWSPVVVAIAVGLWAFNSYPVGVLHDDAVYVILAKSLATHHGYRYLNLPGAPAATHFPPGYPALLSLLWLAAPNLGASVVLFKLANVVFLAVVAAYCRILLREALGFGRAASALLATAAAASVPVIILSALVMSETFFLAVVMIALVAAERALRSPSARRVLLAAALAAMSILIRTHGVALVGALVVALATRRRWRDAAIAAGFGLAALVPWQLWAAAHRANVPEALQGAYGSYGGWLGRALREDGVSFILRTIVVNAERTAGTLSAAVAPVTASAPRFAALAMLLILIAASLSTMWQRARAALLFIACYLVIVLAWPVEPARYLWGVWPLLLILPAVGARAIWQWRGATSATEYARIGLVLATLVAGVGYGFGMAQGYADRYWEDIPRSGALMLRPMVVGIRGHAQPNEVIATPAEAAMYLYTGHQTVPVYTYAPTQLFHNLTLSEKTAALREILTAYPVDALVAASEPERIVAQSVNLFGGVSLAPRDSFAGGTILGVVRH